MTRGPLPALGPVRRALPNYVGVNPIARYDNFTIAGPGLPGACVRAVRRDGRPEHAGFRSAQHRPRRRRPGANGLRQSGSGCGARSTSFAARSIARARCRRWTSSRPRRCDLLTSPEAARAFDLSREDPKIRDRYGRNQWGQQCLMARRLVEAGVEIVTTTFDGPLCGRVANWDDHAVNHHVFDALQFPCPVLRPGGLGADRGHL